MDPGQKTHATKPDVSARSVLSLRINGHDHSLVIDTRTTLLDLLRENIRLTGTKKGCDHGQCGACTVIVDGRRIYACLALAVMLDGTSVTTIEGIGGDEGLHPLQEAFVRHDALQCGFCTPGQICSAIAVLGEIRDGHPSHVTADLEGMPAPTRDELRERMSGNLCRCGAYSNIIDALLQAGESPT